MRGSGTAKPRKNSSTGSERARLSCVSVLVSECGAEGYFRRCAGLLADEPWNEDPGSPPQLSGEGTRSLVRNREMRRTSHSVEGVQIVGEHSCREEAQRQVREHLHIVIDAGQQPTGRGG